MENYIYLKGRKIELTSEQVAQLTGTPETMHLRRLSDIPKSETCEIGGHEFIVLNHAEETTAVLLKDLLHEKVKFGSSNNYDGSNVDKLCCEFAEELGKIAGPENIVEHIVDLTSDDGLDDYGKIGRKVSLFTTEQCREYVKILDKYKLDKYWWTATPYSTPKHDDANWIKCVSPVGILCDDHYDDGYNGVRPFCILKSNIFCGAAKI